MGANKNPTHTEELERKHIHGFVPSPHEYLGRRKMYDFLRELICKKNPMEIVFWDDMITHFISASPSKKIRVQCPHWNHRMAYYSHQAALHLKLWDIDKNFQMKKSSHNHSRYEGIQDKPLTIGDFTKQNYGYECALVSAYKLLHYYMAHPVTKIQI